ncbi:MAG: hypothetical protein CMO04_03925 [Thalassospira sp.]|nr:hypothetical protein [Thalassospira sp.]
MKGMAATKGSAHNLKASQGPCAQWARVSPEKVERSVTAQVQILPPQPIKRPCHLRWQGFLLPAGTVFEPVSFLGSEPSHNLMAEAVKKSLQWSDFKRKVEHGDSRAQTALVGLRHIYPMPVCRFFAKAKGRS